MVHSGNGSLSGAQWRRNRNSGFSIQHQPTPQGFMTLQTSLPCHFRMFRMLADPGRFHCLCLGSLWNDSSPVTVVCLCVLSSVGMFALRSSKTPTVRYLTDSEWMDGRITKSYLGLGVNTHCQGEGEDHTSLHN